LSWCRFRNSRHTIFECSPRSSSDCCWILAPSLNYQIRTPQIVCGDRHFKVIDMSFDVGTSFAEVKMQVARPKGSHATPLRWFTELKNPAAGVPQTYPRSGDQMPTSAQVVPCKIPKYQPEQRACHKTPSPEQAAVLQSLPPNRDGYGSAQLPTLANRLAFDLVHFIFNLAPEVIIHVHGVQRCQLLFRLLYCSERASYLDRTVAILSSSGPA
jgi:hypothetical protein